MAVKFRVMMNSLGASKKQGASASARQTKILSRETKLSRCTDLINGTEFSSIDFGAGGKAVLVWRKALN